MENTNNPDETLIWGKFHNWTNFKIFSSSTPSQMNEAIRILRSCDIFLMECFCSFIPKYPDHWRKREFCVDDYDYIPGKEDPDIGIVVSGLSVERGRVVYVHSEGWNKENIYGDVVWNADNLIEHIKSLLPWDWSEGPPSDIFYLDGPGPQPHIGGCRPEALLLDPRLPRKDRLRIREELKGITKVFDEYEFVRFYIEPEKQDEARKTWVERRDRFLKKVSKGDNQIIRAVWRLCDKWAKLKWIEATLKEAEKFFADGKFKEVGLNVRLVDETIFRLMIVEEDSYRVSKEVIRKAKERISKEYGEPIFYDVLNVWKKASEIVHKTAPAEGELKFSAMELLSRVRHLWNVFKFKTFGMFGIEIPE